MNKLTPGRTAVVDQGRAAARDDLNACILAFRSYADRHGEDAAVSWMVDGLLEQWGADALSWAYAEAIARLLRGAS